MGKGLLFAVSCKPQKKVFCALVGLGIKSEFSYPRPKLRVCLLPLCPASKMTFQMRKAVPGDIPALCAVYFSAFSDTIVGRQVFPPGSEAARVFWVTSLTKDLPDPNFEFLVMTTRSEGDSEDQVVGYAKWVRPGTPIEMPPPADAWPQDGNPALAVEFFGKLTATHKHMMDDRPHWYLSLIGVRKEWMGKGAASPLMRWGVERADEDGLPCFLEATPNAKGMYEKYGFRVVGEQEFESPSGRVLDFYMLRDATTGGK